MDERPTAYGTARTSEAAETDAKDSLLRKFGDYDTNPLPANWARNAYRKVVAAKKAKTPSKTTSACQSEFVYSDWDDDYGKSGSSPHRIVKKTKTRVYVEYDQYATSWEGQDIQFVRTFVLDRKELEETGGSFSRERGRSYFTTPYNVRYSRADADRPECLRILGLSRICTDDDVNRAYRQLAKATHPDHGGNPKAFKRIQEAYENALALVG